MIKRIIALVSVVLITLSSFCITSYAASPVLKVGTDAVNAGETAEIEISIQGNPGIIGMYLDVSYDSRLELKRVNDNGLLKGKLFSANVKTKPFVLSWDDTQNMKDNYSDGVIARLEFKVPDGTSPGRYPVRVTFAQDDIFNSRLENVSFSAVNGYVTVNGKTSFYDDDIAFRSGEYMYISSGTKASDIKSRGDGIIDIRNSYGSMNDSSGICSGNTVHFGDGTKYTCILNGDINGDGSVTAADARLTLRKSVSLETLGDWQIASADIDATGTITAADARMILRASVKLENLDNPNGRLQQKVLQVSDDFSAVNKNTVTNKADYFAAGEYVISQLKEFKTNINIKEYSLHIDDAPGFIKEFVNSIPELFYVNNSVRAYHDNNIVEYFEFKFMENPRTKLTEYRNMVAEIAKKADSSFSPLQKALYFHDYIASNFSYDLSLSTYEAYSLLKNGSGVCQAYALLYMSLLDYHGIESKYVTSEKMKHGWNLVKIGSSWYHVDITWDDPKNDRYGLSYHENFLLSDKAMDKNGHKDWYCCGGNEVCNDTTYDKYFWTDISSPFAVLNNEWYYIDSYASSYGIYRWNKNGSSEIVKSFNAKWSGILGFVWDGCYSGLGVYDNKLIYNTSDTVVSFDPVSGNDGILYKENESGHIYGMTVKDKIYINIASSPDTTNTNISPIAFMNTGDCDGNGRINGKDYSVLMMHLSGYTVHCNTSAADFDLNGKINNKDAEAIRKFVVNG